jgi:hypothetical protein
LALWFFTANDGATTSGPPVAVPGVPHAGTTPLPDDVRRGNVVIALTDARDRAPAEALAREIAGAPTAELRSAGQAVLVDAAGGGTGVGQSVPECEGAAGGPAPCPTVYAYAPDRAFSTASLDDPALRAFVEYWLGRASG